MNTKDIYKQLTNVDIEYQRLLWDERGKGYYGEFLVFNELYTQLSGTCKILMNLNVPTEGGKTTEIDLVLIHETGIYVFEIKHYKGTIYGEDTGNIWTQYFRTSKNSTFKNPMIQNSYHIKALQNILCDIPIKSIIVFTNNNCNIRVKNFNFNVSLCTMYNLLNTLEQCFKTSESILSIQEIDVIFNTLSKYSKMQEPVLYDGKEENFISWLQPTLQKLEEEKIKLINQIIQNKKDSKKRMIINIIIIIFAIIFIIASINSMEYNYNNKLEDIKQNYNTELKKLKQKFKHVDEIDNEYITYLNEYFLVSDVMLNELSSNAVTFTAKISRGNDTYGMLLTEESLYIVMTDDGNIFEYNVFGKHLKYNRMSNMIGKGIRDSGNLAQANFHGVSKDDIVYIKITNIELFKLDISRTVVKDDLELELYYK